jgi:hypothetical protein
MHFRNNADWEIAKIAGIAKIAEIEKQNLGGDVGAISAILLLWFF